MVMVEWVTLSRAQKEARVTFAAAAVPQMAFNNSQRQSQKPTTARHQI